MDSYNYNEDEQVSQNNKRYITRTHNGQNFLYRYRWVIMLVLGVLLLYYICSRNCEPETEIRILELGQGNDFKVPGLSMLSNSPIFDTERRRNWGFR